MVRHGKSLESIEQAKENEYGIHEMQVKVNTKWNADEDCN